MTGNPVLLRNKYSVDRKIYLLKREKEIIKPETRVRLLSLVKFISSTSSFLEDYILVEDKPNKCHYLNDKFVDNFSQAELGYNFSRYFSFRNFDFRPEKLSDDGRQTIENIYNDYVLFDLLETIILFSKKTKRADIINRINSILVEEESGYSIKENIITNDVGEELEGLISQLKDKKLKNKLKSFYGFYNDSDYVNSAKISAEILNIIFSDEKIKKRKKIDKNIDDLASASVEKGSDEKKVGEFKKILNESIKILQNLNNGIYNIRHTEQDRVRISNELIYKMVSDKNISFIEFFITSLKDRHILSENWEKIKEEYNQRYKIDKNLRLYIPDESQDIDINDIPF